MYRHKYIRPWKDLALKMARSETNVRCFSMFFGFGLINVLLYVKAHYYDPAYTAPKKIKQAEEIEALDNKAREILFYNKFGAPTRPLRSLDDVMAFLGGSKTFDDLADFLSYNSAMDMNTDMQNGLDSWMSDQDKGMLDQYRLHMKNAKH